MRLRVREVGGAIAVGAWMVVAACGGAESAGDGWAGTIDTLAGGGVRVSSPAEGIWTEETAWRLVPDLRIGRLEGDGPDLFGQVHDVAVDAAGRILVLEAQAHEVRVFGRDGAYLLTVGRQGQGPGELNVPFGGEVIPVGSDRIWVNNTMNRRWELFAGDGTPIRSTLRRVGTFGAGSVLGRDGAFYQRDALRREGERPHFVVTRWVVDGDSLLVSDTLDAPVLPENQTIPVSLSNAGNQIRMELPVPFVHQPSSSFDPAGHFWVVPGDGYRLVALDTEHDTMRIVERAYAPVPVTAEELDESLRQFREGPLASAGVEVDRSRIPEHHPAFERYMTDPTGNLWVLREVGDGAKGWDVFDPEGRYLGEVRSEVDVSRLTVHEITDDAVYGVLRDELDVQSVVRLRIARGGGGGGA